MKNLINKIKTFLSNEKGGESVEWVVVVGVILVGITAVLILINQQAVIVLNQILTYLTAAATAG